MFFDIRRILGTKKVKGKTQWLVDWVPSYTEEVTQPMLDEYNLYKKGVKIVGPTEETYSKPRNQWEWVIHL